MKPNQGHIHVSITIQDKILEQIEKTRGDISRSRFFEKLAEYHFLNNKKEKEKESSSSLHNSATVVGDQPTVAPAAVRDFAKTLGVRYLDSSIK